MEISDIQEIKQDFKQMFEITFADESTGDDCAKIILSKSDMQQIGKYCQNELSYGAQLRKEKKK